MKEQEFLTTKQELQEADKLSWNELMSGDVFVRTEVMKYFKFLFFVVFLMMMYIANQHSYMNTYKDLRRMKEKVTDLRFTSIELKAELMKFNRQSQVLKHVQDRELGLELSSEPPTVLIDE